MSCEGYRDKLVAALANGESSLDGDVTLHLGGCIECKKFYETQVHLFGAIDSGVRTMVNEAVPASLLPHVRALVAEAGRPRRPLGLYWVPAGVALAFVFLLGAFLMRPKNTPVRVAVGSAAVSHVQKVGESGSARETGTQITGVRRAARESSPSVRRGRPARNVGPDESAQVVVGREEAQGLLLLARSITKHPELGQALLQPAAMTEDLLPASQAIKIEDLAVQPLATQD